MNYRLRKYPYPFKATLAFSNDADFFTLDTMLAFHRYLAEKPENGGIGIDCSDSFFFFQSRSAYPCYSYFKDTKLQEEPHAGLIRELIKAGYLDTTHALGDFEGGNFTRRLAHGALENLDKYGLKLRVWTNHGGYGNIQNVADRNLFYHQQGDDLHSPYYLLDIVEQMGIRYFAICASYSNNMCLMPNGDLITEKKRKAIKTKWIHPKITVNDNFACKPQCWNDRKSIFHKIETRSGTILQGFYRYNCFLGGNKFEDKIIMPDGRCPGPNLGRLSLQIDKPGLDSLIEEEASCFLYQHFSTIRHLPQRTHMTPLLEMHPENINALKAIANYNRQGDIWVASQQTLLDYLYMINTIDVTCRKEKNRLHFYVKLKGNYELRSLEGLSLEISGFIPSSVIIHSPCSREYNANVIKLNEDLYIASIPFRRLPSVDWYSLAKEFSVKIPREIEVKVIDKDKAVGL
jgi:hypothetical protein